MKLLQINAHPKDFAGNSNLKELLNIFDVNMKAYINTFAFGPKLHQH